MCAAVFSSDPLLELASAFLTGSRTEPRLLPWHALTPQDLRVVRAWATQTLSPEPRRRLLSSVRCAVTRGARERPDDAVEGLAPSEVKAATRSRSRREGSRALSSRAVRTLLDACEADPGVIGRRDLAVLLLMLNAGLSAAEVSRLQTSDFDETSGLLRLRAASPRQPRRLVVLDGRSIRALVGWLRTADAGHGPLLRTIRGGAATQEALSPAGVASVVMRRGVLAGLGRLRPGELHARFLAGMRERSRRSDWQLLAARYEDEDGQPALLYHALSEEPAAVGASGW